MEYEEMDNSAEDVLDEVVEETEEVEEESLDTLEEDAAEETEETPKAKEEPGYVKRRIESAVQKALAQERESIRAEMDRQYAPIRDKLLTMEAQELVNEGEFKSLERAKEYLQMKQGIAPKEEQPRNDQGQYTSREVIETETRIAELKKQASKISENSGLDVIEEFNANPTIKKKVISGEMDFYDVADYMRKQKKRPPSPMRSPNGASGTNPNAIDSMSDAQFERMEKRIKEGARYTLR